MAGNGKARARNDRLPVADRKLLCRQFGVPYSGRQWRKLRKGLIRQEARAALAMLNRSVPVVVRHEKAAGASS